MFIFDYFFGPKYRLIAEKVQHVRKDGACSIICDIKVEKYKASNGNIYYCTSKYDEHNELISSNTMEGVDTNLWQPELYGGLEYKSQVLVSRPSNQDKIICKKKAVITRGGSTISAYDVNHRTLGCVVKFANGTQISSGIFKQEERLI